MLDEHVEADLQWRGNVPTSNEMPSTANANMKIAVDAKSISSVVPEPPQSDHASKRKPRKKTKRTDPTSTSKTTANVSTPAESKEAKKERSRIARAAVLRKEYPLMQNIPKSITPSQRKKLILQHTQNAANMLQPTRLSTADGPGAADAIQSKNDRKAANKEKQRNRATVLRQQYPNMEGIPSKIGRGIRKKLIAQYNARSSALAPSVTMPTSSATKLNLPTRPVPLPTAILGMNPTYQPTCSWLSINSSVASGSKPQKQTSNKMAPLSEERRAEVARNLAAGSNSDPVMID